YYDYWEPSKELLNRKQKLLTDMVGYDKDNISESVIKKIKKYIDNPEFTPENAEKLSKAVKAMCEWVRAMYKYHHVSKEVEPKRRALAAAEQELAIMQKRLNDARNALNAVTSKIKQLEEENERAIKRKDELSRQVTECTIKLDRATRLIDGLSGEKSRWT